MTGADVYKGGSLAARITPEGPDTRFDYLPEYQGPPVALSLPLGRSVTRPGRTLPPFFTNLLPEGRRLSSLLRAVKTSADDELSLLLAVGADTVGDVVVVPAGRTPEPPAPLVTSDGPLDFSAMLARYGIDPVAIPGAQDKLSAGMITLPGRTTGGSPAFVKLNPPDHPHAVENEAYFLRLARGMRLPVSDTTLVADDSGTPGLLVRRFDRTPGPIPAEDACQVMGRYPADKYLIPTEEVAGALADVCAARQVALRAVYLQTLFAWLTGNGDQHAKNLSVLREPTGEWRISPIYDVLTTLPYGDHTTAMSIGGRHDGLIRRHILTFAADIGLPPAVAARGLDLALRTTERLDADLAAGVLPFDANTTRTLRRQLARRRRDAQP